MTPQEFTERTGLKPTDEEYKGIENMYLEAGEKIDKDIFCKDYKKHHDSILLNTFFEQSERLNGKCDDFRKQLQDVAFFLIEKSIARSDSHCYDKAVALIGQRAVTLQKIKIGLPLWDEDRDYINSNLK